MVIFLCCLLTIFIFLFLLITLVNRLAICLMCIEQDDYVASWRRRD